MTTTINNLQNVMLVKNKEIPEMSSAQLAFQWNDIYKSYYINRVTQEL